MIRWIRRGESSDMFGSGQTAPTSKQIRERRATLTDWFAPGSASDPVPYELKALWEEAGVQSMASPSSCSWLNDMTRHDVYDMPAYRGYEGADGACGIPRLLVGAKAPAYQGEPRPRARIPVQRPDDRKSQLLAPAELDHNDFVVIGGGGGRFPVPGSLADAGASLAANDELLVGAPGRATGPPAGERQGPSASGRPVLVAGEGPGWADGVLRPPGGGVRQVVSPD
jgi:hypothetical protein